MQGNAFTTFTAAGLKWVWVEVSRCEVRTSQLAEDISQSEIGSGVRKVTNSRGLYKVALSLVGIVVIFFCVYEQSYKLVCYTQTRNSDNG